MKKILSFLLLVISIHLYAQEILITGININIPANPDANTANWGTGSSIFIINASTTPGASGINALVLESKILLSIKKGRSKVCGSYTNATAPLSNFNSVNKVWSGTNAASLLGQNCLLSPGEYELCVQFFDPKSRPLSEEKCKPFTIKAEEQQSYQPPQAISPADGTIISEQDAKSPMTFRWTPVVPKPREEVVYKVRVIEIRQGQTATSAIKTNRPIFEKEVTNQTQLVGTSLNQLPIAENSRYGWYVQATNKEGRPVGENEGISSCLTFTSVNNYGINDEGIKNAPCNCKGTGWIKDKPVIISSSEGKPIGNVNCGNSIPLASTGSYQIAAPIYVCNPANCQPSYTWTVQGPVSASGSGNSFNFNFSAPGTYTVTITPYCGKMECKPCKITVIIKPIDCKCNVWSSLPLKMNSSNGTTTNVMVGSIPTLNTGSYQITAPDYNCDPPTVNCQATYLWEIFFMGGSIGNGSGKTFPFNFSTPGTYTIKITTLCGSMKCDARKYEVNIKKANETCFCEGWYNSSVSIIHYSTTGQFITNVNCDSTIQFSNTGSYQITAPDYSCAPTTCLATYNWQVQGPTTGSSGTGTGKPFTFNFSEPGTYTVSITPICGTKKCEPCQFKIVIQQAPCSLIFRDNLRDYYCVGDQVIINWTGSNNPATVSLSLIDVTNWIGYQTIASNIPNSGSYTWTLPTNLPCNPERRWCFYIADPAQPPQCWNYSTEFTVGCCTGDCDCGNWSPLTIFNVPYLCGRTIPWTCNRAFNFTASYQCIPNDSTCRATTTWEVRKGTVINSGTGTNTLNGSFTPTENGTYDITLTASCNGVVCNSCYYKVVVTGCCQDSEVIIKKGAITIPNDTSCIESGPYSFNLNITPSSPSVSGQYYLTTTPNNAVIPGGNFTSGTAFTFDIPLYECGLVTGFKLTFIWRQGQDSCIKTIERTICPTCCENIKLDAKSINLNGSDLYFTAKFSVLPPLTFSKVKVQILEITVNGAPRTNANILEIKETSVPWYWGDKNLAITTPGNAIWFPGPLLDVSSGILTFNGRIINVPANPLNKRIRLVLRFTFYQTNGPCDDVICEKDINYSLR